MDVLNTIMDITLWIIAILAFFGGYEKIREWRKPKPRLVIDRAVQEGEKTLVFWIKNVGNATEYIDSELNYTLYDKTTGKLIRSYKMPIAGGDNIYLPPSFSHDFGVEMPRYEPGHEYEIFVILTKRGKEAYELNKSIILH